MSDLQARFDQAQIDVKGLSERPANMTLLRLYALYKQGAEGDAHGDKPGFKAAEVAAARLTREGRKVKIAKPPIGRDFNDLLCLPENVTVLRPKESANG